MKNTLLTARQVQDLLHVDRTTIYRMLKDGRLTGIKVGQQWRFSAREVDDLLAGVLRMEKGPANTSDVLPLHCMQPIQDVFAEVANIGSVTTDKKGQPLTNISNSCEFCNLIMSSEKGYQGCIQSWRLLAEQKSDAPEFIACHAGLEYARARVEVNGELVAHQVVGQFYVNPPDPQEEKTRLIDLSEKYQIDLELLEKAIRKIRVLETREVSRISGWLNRVASTFERIGKERADLMNRLRKISAMSELKL